VEILIDCWAVARVTAICVSNCLPACPGSPERLPNAIRQHRIRVKLSQRKRGRALGRSRGAVSSWERGLTFPEGAGILHLAKRLNTLVEGLYADLCSADQYFEEAS